MTSHTIRIDDLEEWKNYYYRLDTQGPYHEPEYFELLEKYFGHGDETAELFIYEGADAFVYYPYLVRPLDTISFTSETKVDVGEYCDITSSWYYGGPLLSPMGDDETVEAFRDAFSSYCHKAGIVAEFLRYDPNLENNDTFDVVHSEFNRETVPVDLSKSKEGLWGDFEKRNRNAIRQGQESGLVVEPTRDADDCRAFYEIYSNAMEARDASEHYRFDVEFFLDLLSNPERASLLVARDGDEVIGGAIVVHDEKVGHDYLRASNPEYWDQRVNNLLCYEALMFMRDTGRELFDFQGGRPGVFKFKKAFSSDRREFYIGKEIHHEDVYDQLVADAVDAGIDTDEDYFPGYRVAQSN